MLLSLPLRGIVTWIVAALVTVPASTAPLARAALPGVSPDLTWGVSRPAMAREIQALRRVGVRWVRLTLDWDYVEPRPGVFDRYNLRMYDAAIRASRRHGLKVLLLVSRSPSWASGSANPEAPPLNPAHYGEFVRFLARRYAGLVAAYEVWNEEDQARFWPVPGGPNPAAYVSLLAAGYIGIKSEDPTAAVLFGGVTNDADYVEQAYAAGAKPYFDVMADHPYSCAQGPDVVRRVAGRILPSSFLAYREVHQVMVQNGDGGKPMWLTEFGWSTTSGSCGVSDRQQATYLSRAYRLMSTDHYVRIGFWYDWRNNYPYRDANTYEGQFGLLHTNWRPKPAYAAFARYVRRFAR